MIDNATLENLPGAIGYKGKCSTYLGANTHLAKLMGFDKPQDIVGMRDTDIRSDMVALADRFIKQDKIVMQYGQTSHIDVGHYPDGNFRVVLATKKPLYDRQQTVIGTIFSRNEINTSFTKYCFKQNYLSKTPGYFSLVKNISSFNLSERESETLFYLLRGNTAKDIASRLLLSHKTIEYHIQQLKNKLNCSKKSELIDKAISLGLFFQIPLSIIQ